MDKLYKIKRSVWILTVLIRVMPAMAQPEVNYDESLIPPYTLPELLKMQDGRIATTSNEWKVDCHPETFRLFEEQMFGKSPEHPLELHFRVLTEDVNALNGLATRREVGVYFTADESYFITVLMYIPNRRTGAVPLFFGLNFRGNHAIHPDEGITITEKQMKLGERMAKRGAASSRWPVEMLMEKGYALATVHNGDIEPDEDNGFQKGLHPLFYKKGQQKPAPDEWGTLAAWSFGMSCVMDYFETDKDIDFAKVISIGHSRNGKAALWAGASDSRFALIVSNDSGCGGAALSRRRIGETVEVINTMFPHWFCGNFKQYNGQEDQLLFDQHQLIALMAPRPVYIASAEEDRWADPKGEFLSGVYATPVYELFGLKGLTVTEMPPVNQPVMDGYIGYHIRPGIHDITYYDWEQFIRFADIHLRE